MGLLANPVVVLVVICYGVGVALSFDVQRLASFVKREGECYKPGEKTPSTEWNNPEFGPCTCADGVWKCLPPYEEPPKLALGGRENSESKKTSESKLCYIKGAKTPSTEWNHPKYGPCTCVDGVWKCLPPKEEVEEKRISFAKRVEAGTSEKTSESKVCYIKGAKTPSTEWDHPTYGPCTCVDGVWKCLPPKEEVQEKRIAFAKREEAGTSKKTSGSKVCYIKGARTPSTEWNHPTYGPCTCVDGVWKCLPPKDEVEEKRIAFAKREEADLCYIPKKTTPSTEWNNPKYGPCTCVDGGWICFPPKEDDSGITIN